MQTVKSLFVGPQVTPEYPIYGKDKYGGYIYRIDKAKPVPGEDCYTYHGIMVHQLKENNEGLEFCQIFVHPEDIVTSAEDFAVAAAYAINRLELKYSVPIAQVVQAEELAETSSQALIDYEHTIEDQEREIEFLKTQLNRVTAALHFITSKSV